MHSLDGPKIKLARAKKHFKLLADAIDDFVKNQKPYTYVIEPQANPRQLLLRAHINKLPDP